METPLPRTRWRTSPIALTAFAEQAAVVQVLHRSYAEESVQVGRHPVALQGVTLVAWAPQFLFSRAKKVLPVSDLHTMAPRRCVESTLVVLSVGAIERDMGLAK